MQEYSGQTGLNLSEEYLREMATSHTGPIIKGIVSAINFYPFFLVRCCSSVPDSDSSLLRSERPASDNG